MSNVIDFQTRRHIQFGNVVEGPRVSYTLTVHPTVTGFDYDLVTDSAAMPTPEDLDDIAADLAAIALSLRPPPRTFLERLKALIFGD